MIKRIFCFLIAFTLFIPIIIKMPFAYSKAENSKLRIGYVESEDFYDFSYQMANIFTGLQELNVIDNNYKINTNEPDSSKVWNNICDNYKSDKVEFVKDMYFDMKYMNQEDYVQMTNRNDVDLVIVMGTVAGKYFLENETKNKFMVFAAADPIAAGIVKSATERYTNNSFAHIDNTRYERQIKASHKILNFKKIGVVYQNTEEAYTYSAIDQLKNAAAELNFEIVEKHVDEAKNQNDYNRYYADLRKAYKELANEGIDTLYITTATIENEQLLNLLEPDIYANKIYTIAQTTESQVKSGALLGVTIQDPREQGYFGATQIKAFIDGTPFEQLDQVNEGTPKLYLNYDVAKLIDLKIPFSILLITDTIYKLENNEG